MLGRVGAEERYPGSKQPQGEADMPTTSPWNTPEMQHCTVSGNVSGDQRFGLIQQQPLLTSSLDS